jgi:hypothetical protein
MRWVFSSGLEARGGYIGEKPAAHEPVKAPNRCFRQAENARISGQKSVKMLVNGTRKSPCTRSAQGPISIVLF